MGRVQLLQATLLALMILKQSARRRPLNGQANLAAPPGERCNRSSKARQ
ncbi:hypothetical protein HM1_1455 [Heliomicrobium modesticaldum Ice1]|uniref:Uncharacterized protein n=1 Tax=Heliobacterium modesticaldum (strain ATCC 51547 / Ice1) TaxID=498761 RepID=B0TCK2_HELMI|nr:hypothetical protein HM1_1455 [Heliomicrobium modesticaldum Ice1]